MGLKSIVFVAMVVVREMWWLLWGFTACNHSFLACMQHFAVFKIDPEDQCNRNCGDGGCVLDFAGSPQCVCNNGAVKDDTGYCATLVVDESGNPVNPASSSDNSTLYIIIGVAVGMLILVTILAGFFCFRRRQNAAYKQENYGYKQ
jgi:hypothetical protein